MHLKHLMDNKQTVKWQNFMRLDDEIADDFCNRFYKYQKWKDLIISLILRKQYVAKILEEANAEKN